MNIGVDLTNGPKNIEIVGHIICLSENRMLRALHTIRCAALVSKVHYAIRFGPLDEPLHEDVIVQVPYLEVEINPMDLMECLLPDRHATDRYHGMGIHFCNPSTAIEIISPRDLVTLDTKILCKTKTEISITP